MKGLPQHKIANLLLREFYSRITAYQVNGANTSEWKRRFHGISKIMDLLFLQKETYQ